MVQIDRKTVIQILGSLMIKPSLLDETDRYQIEPSDFSVPLDKYIYSAIFNLYAGGAERIRAVDIDTYLQSNESAKLLFQNENGIGFIQDCETQCEPENFSYYYGRLKKFALLKELEKSGQDVSNFYCTDVFNPRYSEINNKFEQMSASDIIKEIKGQVATLENKYSTNSLVEESNAYQGVRDLIETLKVKPEVGVQLQGDIFNTITRGGRRGVLYLRSAGSGIGKALPNYTKIPTSKGWKTVGEIKVGDYLFDKNGKPTKVLAVYPQEEKKQIYKVYFKSGRIAECCDEHLWSFYSNKNDKHPNKLITSTLRDIIDNPKGLQDGKGSYRWSIPICKPVQYEKKEYSVDPYVMGLILGDGSFRYNETNKALIFSSSDEELVKSICERQGYKTYIKNSIHNYNWSFKLSEKNTHQNVWVEDILKDYPQLWNKKSENKFIPEDFMFGSIEQRYDLLSGLLDTDGSIDSKGRVSFTTVSPFLRDNVISLCESLGMICNYCIDIQKEKYTTGECYAVHIQAKKEDKVKLFKLKRKVDIAKQYMSNGRRTERRDRDSIIDIKATDIYTNMTCFYVDNEEHLFLMNNYICTHNTRSMVADACKIAYPIRFDNVQKRWVATGSCEPVLYIMTEQDPSEIQTMILAYLTGINEEYFLYGTFREEHMDRILTAMNIMERYQDNLLFVRIPDPCSSLVKNIFHKYAFRFNIQNFFYDYIFSSPAMLNEFRDLKVREDVSLRLFTTTLKNLAIELDAFVMTATQVSNNDDKTSGFMDFRNVQGSRAIVNLVDFACVMSRPTPEDLKMVGGFKSRFGYEPNLITDVFKNRRGRWTMCRIWSYMDLGIMRRIDLFVTTPTNELIEEFQIVDFCEERTKEMDELEELYNNGVITDAAAQELIDNFVKSNPTQFSSEIEEAFGNQEETRKRVHESSFEDFLGLE